MNNDKRHPLPSHLSHACDAGNGDILAIIPARRNSKGIPGKNIKNLCGKPLIAYTIETALASVEIDRVVVSTDSSQIADISRHFGAEAPFLRPESIAGDTSPLQHVVEHTLSELATTGYVPSAIVLMYPTQPFRRVETVDLVTRKLRQGYETVAVYMAAPHPRHSFYFEDDSGLLHKIKDKHFDPEGRQYVSASGYLHGRVLARNTTTYGEYAHCTDDYREVLDIDEPHHFHFAREVINNNLYPFPA